MDKRTEFLAEAIKNGYTGSNCSGWDWIRDNLGLLDDYFQREDYKVCNGMKYKCLPILSRGLSLSLDEENILSTAWYLNNERVHEKEGDNYGLMPLRAKTRGYLLSQFQKAFVKLV